LAAVKPKVGVSESLMNLKEWEKFADLYKLYDNGFSKRCAKLCFGWSKMRMTEELLKRQLYTSMHFTDFLEALCRVAELKSWPSRGDLEDAGCETMIDFFKKADKNPMLLKLLDDNVQDVNGMGEDKGTPLCELVDKLLQLIVARCDRRIIDGTLGAGAFTTLSNWETERRTTQRKSDLQ
jgi:hypothetical protein